MLKGCRFPFELENWIPDSQTFLFPKGSRGALFRWLPHVCTSCSYNRLVGNLQLQRQWRSIVSLSTHKPKSNQKRRNNLRWCHNCSARLTFWAKSSNVSNWKRQSFCICSSSASEEIPTSSSATWKWPNGTRRLAVRTYFQVVRRRIWSVFARSYSLWMWRRTSSATSETMPGPCANII